MTTWFTADLHLGHRNIISYCDRPFESVGAMNRALIARWNEAVDDDVVCVEEAVNSLSLGWGAPVGVEDTGVDASGQLSTT
jgi:hypothetical protein